MIIKQKSTNKYSITQQKTNIKVKILLSYGVLNYSQLKL